MQKCESDFLQLFLFFEKFKSFNFLPEQSAEGNYRLRNAPFRPKRSKSLKLRRWSSFRSKMTQAALFHTCTTFLRVLGAPKRVWALKTRFGATFALWDLESVRVAGAVGVGGECLQTRPRDMKWPGPPSKPARPGILVLHHPSFS